LKTLAEVTTATGFEVLEHLEAETEVPVLDGLQAQGDLFIVPAASWSQTIAPQDGYRRNLKPVAVDGIPVIEAVNGGHEHRLFAGTPGTAFWAPSTRGGQDIGVLECTQPAYLLHPEHGATGLAPGTYVLRRQREQAEEERLVAD
jgi:hypothetical protein